MPIPEFNASGLLFPGVYDCTLEEIESRFGRFQGSDRRPQLWAKFKLFFLEAKASGLVEVLVLDGSFVTADPAPNDIDVIVVVFGGHNFETDLPPQQYNVLAQATVRRRFGLDIVVAKNGTDNLAEAVAFFTQVRQRPGMKKGVLRLRL